MVDKSHPDKRNKLLLIANFHDEPTGKAAALNDGRIMVWNAMGAFGWQVPNNWHVITNFAKIIAHELHYFDQGSPINYTSGIIPIVAQTR